MYRVLELLWYVEIAYFFFSFCSDLMSLISLTDRPVGEELFTVKGYLLVHGQLTSSYITKENVSPFTTTINWRQILREGGASWISPSHLYYFEDPQLYFL